MNKQEYLKNTKDVIYLVYCALNGRVPGRSRLEKTDLAGVYDIAQDHLLTAMCAMALESAGIKDDRFTQAMGKAIRKNAQLDIDRAQIIKRLEQEKIWYMPLKGALLKDIYPRYGMRQMSDNDILVDSGRMEDVKNIMQSLGFTVEHYGHGAHDAYFKLPVSNFEMHHRLFDPEYYPQIHNYYQNIKDSLIKDDDNNFGYHFSNEDFYIYMLAHEYKHYQNGGTGIRSVVDIYVYLREYADTLDMEYIKAECRKLGIDEFELQSRSLAMDLFNKKKLTDKDKEMLRYIIDSGTYGTIEHSVDNKVSQFGSGIAAKIRYIFSRLFVPVRKSDPMYAAFRSFYPWFYEKKYRLPLLVVYRWGRALTSRRDLAKAEIKILTK